MISDLNRQFIVLGFLKDRMAGGPVDGPRFDDRDIEGLKKFMATVGYPLSPEQVSDAKQKRHVRSTMESRHAFISPDVYQRHFA
jgi:hypothetical protein